MRQQKPTNLIIPFAAILIALILGMMLVEPDFFELGEKRRYKEVDSDFHIIDLGRFSLRTPKTFRYVELEGIDSFVGLITDNTDSIEFDFGKYSNDLTSEDWRLKAEQVNGRKAVIGYSNAFGTAAHLPNLGNGYSLTIYARAMPEETALGIFRTIKIPN